MRKCGRSELKPCPMRNGRPAIRPQGPPPSHHLLTSYHLPVSHSFNIELTRTDAGRSSSDQVHTDPTLSSCPLSFGQSRITLGNATSSSILLMQFDISGYGAWTFRACGHKNASSSCQNTCSIVQSRRSQDRDWTIDSRRLALSKLLTLWLDSKRGNHRCWS